jgi:hypothetical protein
MSHQNIEPILARLLTLGCDPSIETQLRCQLCFSSTPFDLTSHRSSAEDRYSFMVRMERGSDGVYQLKYYTAVLRKNIDMPRDLFELDKRMGKIDWMAIAKGRHEPVAVSAAMIQTGSELVNELQVLGGTADVLKYKYWQGTPLEKLVVNIGQHRTAWEISERFYFFNDLDVISFADATRFLNSRWMERHLHARKKLLEKNNEEKTSGAGKDLLLKKRPGRTAKNNLLKK